MSELAVVACLGALLLIGALPRIFFRRGRLNARWWLTAAPFGVAAVTLIAHLVGVIDSPVDPARREQLAWGALIAAGAGVALIRWALLTHARPVSLWHQEDDRPDELMTRGAYAHVRHPLYAAFLLVLLACVLALPHALTVVAFVAGFVLLDRTAAREERRLRDAFGDHYGAYVRRTGRFVPRLAAQPETDARRTIGPMLLLALFVAAPAPGSAQETDFSQEPPAAERTYDDDPDDLPSRLRALRMPEPRSTAPHRDEDGLFDALWAGGLLGLGTGLVLMRDDAPPDVLIGSSFGGAAGAATAYASGFRNDQGVRALLGSVVGTAAGVGVGYALANADVDGVVVMISSSALSAMFGVAVSWLMDGT